MEELASPVTTVVGEVAVAPPVAWKRFNVLPTTLHSATSVEVAAVAVAVVAPEPQAPVDKAEEEASVYSYRGTLRPLHYLHCKVTTFTLGTVALAVTAVPVASEVPVGLPVLADRTAKLNPPHSALRVAERVAPEVTAALAVVEAVAVVV